MQQRADEVRTRVQELERRMVDGRVKIAVGPQGGIAFQGWEGEDRAGITDNCAYRRIMSTGSATARMAIARAEQLAGRTVSRSAVAQGVHSHDGGRTWHDHKG